MVQIQTHLKIRDLQSGETSAAVPVGSLVRERFQTRQARRGRGGHLEGPHQARLVRGVAVGAPACRTRPSPSAMWGCAGWACRGPRDHGERGGCITATHTVENSRERQDDYERLENWY